jgi:protein-arginine kinase activator protein McsA
MLEQFRGQVIMMRTRAEAELALQKGQPKQALAALDRGLNELRSAYDDAERLEDFDKANEVQLLRGMRDALVPKLPTSQRVELQERLRAAIDAENYELAAILRDELRMLGD